MPQLVGVFVALVGISFVALLYPGVARLLIWAQVGYWTVSYLVRPSVLVFAQPAPRRGDSIADPRLAFDAYSRSLESVLGVVQFGLFTYLVVLGLLAIAFRTQLKSPFGFVPRMDDPALYPTLITVWMIGWSARSMAILGLGGEVVDLLALLAVAGSFGLLLRGPARSVASAMLLSLVAISEVGWALISSSKTPLIATALAIALRVMLSRSGRRAWTLLGVGVATVALFPVLQALKQSELVRGEVSFVDASYPDLLQPFLSIVRRFDLLSAATDAVYIGPGGWITMDSYVSRALGALVPSPLLPSEKVSAGQAWADEVRAHSTGAMGDGVSLADGFVAEGWALAGHIGVLGQAVVLASVLLFASWAVTRRSAALVAWGAMLLSYPILFERGALGVLSVVGKTAQAVIIVWVISFMISGILQSRTLHRRDPLDELVDA